MVYECVSKYEWKKGISEGVKGQQPKRLYTEVKHEMTNWNNTFEMEGVQTLINKTIRRKIQNVWEFWEKRSQNP